MLVRHRGDVQRERLVRREEPVAAGEDVTLEPALAVVLAEHLHDAAGRRDVVVDVEGALLEADRRAAQRLPAGIG